MTSAYLAKTLVDRHQEDLTQARGVGRGWRWRHRREVGATNARPTPTGVDGAVRRPLGSPHH